MITWVVLARWTRRGLEGHSLEVQEAQAIREYPAFADVIRLRFELGRLQLEALEALEKQNAIAFSLDLWRFFRDDRIEKTAVL